MRLRPEHDKLGAPTHESGEPLSDDERRQLVSAERDARAAAEAALAALAKSEARFRSIVETTTEWMWATDVEGRLTYSNAAVESMLGYRAEELLGRDSFELIHAEDQKHVLAIFRGCIEKATGWSGLVVRWRHRDGSYRYLESNGIPILGRSGELEGFRGSDRDVTERMEAEEKLRAAEERYRILVEELPIITYARTLELGAPNIYASPQVEELLGYSVEDWKTDPDLFPGIVHPNDRERVLAEAAHLRRTGEPLQSEYRCVTRDGRVVWLRDETRIVRDDEGRPLYVQGYLLDITEKRAVEDALVENEERFRTLVSSMPGAIFRCVNDGGWRTEFISSPIEDISGYAADEFLGENPHTLNDLVHPEDFDRVCEAFEGAARDGRTYMIEYRMVHRDGSVRWVMERGRGMPRGDGTRVLDGAIFDVTERHEAQQARFKLAAVVESTDDAIIGADLNGIIQAWNGGAEKMFGFAAGEAVGSHLSIIAPPGRAGEQLETIERLKRGEPVVHDETVRMRKDGTPIDVALTVSPIVDASGTVAGFSGILRDITKRKRAEQAVRVSEERFRTLVANIPGAIYRCACDPDWTMEFISEEVESITGYPPSDFLGRIRSFASVIHPEDRNEVERAVLESVREKRPFVLEYRVVTADARVRWVYEKGQGVLGADGEALWIDGAIFDVTERKQIERDLAAQNERLVEAEKITHLGSWSWDVAANSVTWSDEMFRIWGLDPARFGASYEAYLDTVHPDDRSFVQAQVQEALVTGGFDYECRIVRRDGGERFIHARANVLYDENGTPLTMIGTTQDITERKEIEAERERLLAQERAQNARLRELDRLKDTFVASVSHELRTPLTSISGFLQLMKDGLAGETTEEQRRCLAIAGRNADRLHRLIGDLLFVAQMDAGQLVLEPTQVDLRALAAECLESVRPRAMQAGVEVVLEGDAVAGLQGDPSRLTQLLDNLVSNAIKFSLEGGQVAVRTMSENGNVVLEVADHGIGIPAAQQQHLFKRFFRGSNAAERAIQGTGIGLSIVKAIVDAHGGSIAVESREGAGTTFRVAFPLRMPPVAPRPKRVEAA